MIHTVKRHHTGKQAIRAPTKQMTLYGLMIIISFFVVGLLVIKATHASTSTVSIEAEAGVVTAPAMQISDNSASGGAAAKFTAPQSLCGSGGSCTAAQVAPHNNKTNCWVIYSKKVYDITAWVPQHPGGESVYNSTTCGHDITSFLTGQSSSNGVKHKHSGSAYNNLDTYYLAPLQ
jgi:hypothetical protein